MASVARCYSLWSRQELKKLNINYIYASIRFVVIVIRATFCSLRSSWLPLTKSAYFEYFTHKHTHIFGAFHITNPPPRATKCALSLLLRDECMCVCMPSWHTHSINVSMVGKARIAAPTTQLARRLDLFRPTLKANHRKAQKLMLLRQCSSA